MRPGSPCVKLLKVLILFSLCAPALADGLIVPKVGGCLVLSPGTLAKEREFKMDTKAVPLLAAHPSAPVVASVTPEQGLVFWNTPGFSEASRAGDPLLKDGIVDMAFSADGNSLYLLSAPLRAVLVYDLSSSKLAGVVPVPGSDGKRIKSCEAGVLVRQDDGVSLLSPTPKPGLLAQYRYSQPLLAALCEGDRLYTSIQGDPGIWVYDLKAGQTLGLLPAQGSTVSLGPRAGEKGVVMVESSGIVSARDFKSATPNWTYQGTPANSLGVELLSGGQSLYVFNSNSGSLVALAGDTGKVQASAELGSEVGRPCYFLGQ